MSKFLTYEDRLVIAQLLQENVSFGVIGNKLGKDRTTIAKEIKKHSYDKKSGRPGYPYNPCKHRSTCKAKKLCGNSCTHQSAYKCSLCSECTLHCLDFAEDICSVKTKPPYVCNGCSQLSKCTLLKRIYDPSDAHEMAHQSISESRTGILSNEDDIARINGIISPLVKNGQSLHQIYIEHVDEIMCSEKTLYNYVDAQLFDIRNIDLPRKVKYRPRYKQPEFKVDRAGPVIGILFLCINTLQGMGKALQSLLLTVCRQGLAFIPMLFILNKLFQLNGVIYAQSVADFISIVIAGIICGVTLWHVERKFTE